MPEPRSIEVRLVDGPYSSVVLDLGLVPDGTPPARVSIAGLRRAVAYRRAAGTDARGRPLYVLEEEVIR